MSAGSGLSKRSRLPVTGCTKASPRRMQRLAVERVERRLRVGPELARARLEARAVGHVAEQGMADVGQVHAHLVRAAGLEREREQAGDGLRLAPADRSPAPRSG